MDLMSSKKICSNVLPDYSGRTFGVQYLGRGNTPVICDDQEPASYVLCDYFFLHASIFNGMVTYDGLN